MFVIVSVMWLCLCLLMPSVILEASVNSLTESLISRLASSGVGFETIPLPHSRNHWPIKSHKSTQH